MAVMSWSARTLVRFWECCKRCAARAVPTTAASASVIVALATLAAMAAPRAYSQAEFFPPSPGISMDDFPNIVLITGDHLRWDHIAANGNDSIITPHMDRLVREGTTFRFHFTVGVACAPNRASLMTGRYPLAHGVISNGIKMPRDEVTLTHVLREAGYYTGQMGKLHFWPHKDRDHREAHPPYGFHQMRLSDEPGAVRRRLWPLALGTGGGRARESARQDAGRETATRALRVQRRGPHDTCVLGGDGDSHVHRGHPLPTSRAGRSSSTQAFMLPTHR